MLSSTERDIIPGILRDKTMLNSTERYKITRDIKG